MKHQLSIIALLLFVTFPGSDLSAQEGSSRIGLGDYGQTSILDNRFNPALSFIGDFVATWSDDEGIEAGADGFKLRGAEIGLFGAVDDAYEFHGILFFDEEEVELEEAYVHRNRLAHSYDPHQSRSIQYGLSVNSVPSTMGSSQHSTSLLFYRNTLAEPYGVPAPRCTGGLPSETLLSFAEAWGSSNPQKVIPMSF